MAFELLQVGTTLQLMDVTGVAATLTLPTNIVLSSITPRFALFGRYVIMVNSPSRPITIDPLGVCRVLCPRPPSSQIALSAVAGGGLTGTYTVRQTFMIKDALGNVLAESDFGPISASQAVSAQYLKAAGLDLSPDDVTLTRMYRTTTLGTTYFPWIDVDGNTQTAVQDDLADAGLSLVAAPTLGSVPDLTLIAEWRGRLWGVDRSLNDDLRYSETGRMYAWPVLNDIPVPKIGADSRGITALISRKDALGVGKQNVLQQISGNNDNSLFRPVKITENCGVESQESVAVFLDTAYFLWIDGVYQWNSEGVKCISDGKVRSWFATGDYFNQSKFRNAFGFVDPNTKRYKLFLCSAGSSTIDRWVEYDIISGKWWGPHKTGAFTPSCALIMSTAADVLIPAVGSASGYLYKEQATRTDSSATAIDFDVDTKRHDAGTPTVTKAFLDLRMTGVPLASGRLTITPTVGDLDATASTKPLSFPLTDAYRIVGKVGVGTEAGLNFRETTVGQDVQLTGYELDFIELGQR